MLKALGVISLTGAVLGVAIATVGGWSVLTLGLVPPTLDEEGGDRLAIHFLRLIFFYWGIPLLCVPALAFGVLARRMWTGRFGMAAAGLSLSVYMLFWVLIRL